VKRNAKGDSADAEQPMKVPSPVAWGADAAASAAAADGGGSAVKV
jgi:hypothetical protein